MAQRKKPTKRANLPTQADILLFAQWVLMVAFTFLVIAAIITTSTKLMYYSVVVGMVIAYGIYKRWFDV